ncbi:hypothetical protein ACU6QD_07155 [Corynebacterium glucuronolyticum]
MSLASLIAATTAAAVSLSGVVATAEDTTPLPNHTGDRYSRPA